MTEVTLHGVAVSSQLVGIECGHCYRHALLSAEQFGAKAGDMRTLDQLNIRCSECGSRRFTAQLFQSRSAAHAFMRNH